MNRLFGTILVGILMSIPGVAGDKKYVKPLTVKEPTAIADLLANPEKYNGQRVMLDGTITDVCQNMGCWITMKDTSSEKEIQVKVDDGVIVFPKDSKGKTVRAEGTVSVRMLSEEDRIKRARHEAEEQSREFDESSIKGPATIILLEGEGAVIVEEAKSEE